MLLFLLLRTRQTLVGMTLLTIIACSKFDAAPIDAPDAGGSDSGGVAPGDAAVDQLSVVPGCTGLGPIIGIDTLLRSPSPDQISTAVDAYGYRNSGLPTAVTCVHVWVEDFTASAGLRVGVYSNGGDAPDALLASASLPTLQRPAWNQARLDKPVPIDVSGVVWIAVLPTGQTPNVTVRTRDGCTGADFRLKINDKPVSQTLPNPFAATNDFGRCDAAFFLSK